MIGWIRIRTSTKTLMAHHAGCVTRTDHGSDMDTDYGRLYVTMAEKFLDRADTRKLLPAHLSQKQSAAAKV